MTETQRERLIQTFASQLLAGEPFERITVARAAAAALWDTPITAGGLLVKVVDEAMEAAVVRSATISVQSVSDTHTAYDRLVDLLDQQPRLGVRTSTSVLQQAYSTPVPIAYLAASLADIQPEHWVYEPTAGNGALLITANPAQVIANELNPDRCQELTKRGFALLTQIDATQHLPARPVDRVIANPPFGAVADPTDPHGGKKKFQMFETFTQQIDQAIAYRSLAAMKDDGRAVLILGSKPGSDAASRSNRYHSRESRGFYKQLYEQYNVIDHFTLSGELYRKQGAGFPIDLVVIAGRGQSARRLPAADVPLIYDSFEQLKQEKLPHVPIRRFSPSLESQHRRSATILRSRPAAVQRNQQNTIPEPHGAAPSGIDSGLGGARIATGRTSVDESETAPVQSRQRTTQPEGARLDKPLERDTDPVQRNVLGQGGDRPSGLSSRPDRPRDDGIRADSSDPYSNQPRKLAQRIEDNLMSDTPHELNALIEAKQVPYTPRSQAPAIGTLIPTNMAAPAQAALDRFEQQHGNIDDFLVQKLGYADRPDMYQHFSGEQVDGAALAIASIEVGDAFVNGYQTGIGKGRICAAIMRYAQQEGKAAIFVTQNAGLYADMIRDTSDIGMSGFSPFITDNDKKIDFPDGRSIRSASGDSQIAAMQQVAAGVVQYDAVFTTYTQLQAVKGEEPYRREFLRQLSPRSILILDEAHEAGGSSQGEFGKKGAAPNRAEFARELVDLSSGAYFSSATAIKRPDVIDLYARKTDLRTVVDDIDQLQDILNAGGVPLQQMVAAGLTEGGDMMRLERSFTGISFNPQVVPVDRAMAENLATAMRAIRDFDLAKNVAVKQMDEQFKEAGEQLRPDNAVGDRGIKSTNFTSLMHNVISQSLMAMKAEATVQTCIEVLEQGQKPVIALDNTMGSAIEWYAETHAVQPGDPIDLSFKDLLTRYLDRSREVIVQDWRGESERRSLTKEELGPVAFTAYGNALRAINTSDFAAMPVSPIDYIKHRLQTEGYQVGEVTGRKSTLQYAEDGTTTYAPRSMRETSTNAKTETVRRFNGGELDVVILNRSGSTGISLHASEKFADQRPRHMMMLQPSGDINQVMQMFGRVNRTGQVELPQYTLLMSDLPAEKRPGAILARKMASLNANTTAARESDLSLKAVVDFFNPYGEVVVANILREDWELDTALGNPYEKWSEAESTSKTTLIEKVTGRIPLLPLAEQEKLYTQIETGYCDLLATKQALGENDLEARRLALDAKPIAVMEIVGATGDGPFKSALRVELLDVKASDKPPTTAAVLNAMRDRLCMDDDGHDLALHAHMQQIQTAGRAYSDVLKDDLNQSTAAYLEQGLVGKGEEGATKFTEKVTAQRRHVAECLREYAIGTIVEFENNTGTHYGVVTDLVQTGQTKNPAAASNWRMSVALPLSSQPVSIPFSQVNQANGSAVEKVLGLTDVVLNDFDRYQTEARTQVQMLTGNLIAGFSKFPQGRFVNFTTATGEVRQGLMLAQDMDIAKELANQMVKMPDTSASKAFLGEWTEYQGWLKTNDLNLRIKGDRDGGLTLMTESARAKGGKYYLDQRICEAAGSEFISVGGAMRLTVAAAQAAAVLNVIQAQYPLFADSHQAIARSQLGIELPTFVPVELPSPTVDPAPAIAQPEPESPVELMPNVIAVPEAISFGENVGFVQADIFGGETVIVAPPSVIEPQVYEQAVIVLNVAVQAFAFGADHNKFEWAEDGGAIYRGQNFDFCYQPEGAVFTVSSKADGVLVQTIDNQINSDQIHPLDPTVVARFTQLGQLMTERGVNPSTSSPAASYAAAIAQHEPSTVPIDATELTQWHTQAQAIGRSPEYLDKIVGVTATALSSGHITAQAADARKIDGQLWQSMVERTADHAATIIAASGTPTASGKSFVGRIYRVDATHDRLTINAKDRGEILRVEQGAIVQAQITNQDAQLFEQQVQYTHGQQRGHPVVAGIDR